MQLADIVEQLSKPAFYPEPTESVDVIHTHISVIFLTRRHAWKVKKPVNFGFLDYTTLAKRRTMCEREVELNVRLCPDVYLGVVPITAVNGALEPAGDGEVVEYAVKMTRLPEERMLRHVLARGEGTPDMVAEIARVLARFHASADTSPRIADMKRLAGVKFNCDENLEQTERYVGTLLDRSTFERIRSANDGFFHRHRDFFERRADEGRIRDGHGDLHLDSICMTEPVSIFDCIEFNERFRCQDVAEDVGFLVMDLEHHGFPDLARAFVDAYVEASGDREMVRLLDFYKCYRAYVRAKVNSFQLDDTSLPADRREEVESTARRYYELALRCADAFDPQRLFVTCGLTGSGKSVLARKLEELYDVRVVRSDVVRKELLGLPPGERCWVPYGSGEYTSDITERTYDAMVDRADALLAAGHSVVLDGCFIKRAQRKKVYRIAERRGVPLLLLECVASEEVVRARLDRRAAKTATVSDGRWEIYCGQRRELEPPDELPDHQRVVLDRSRPIDELVGVLEGIVPEPWREQPARPKVESLA